MNECCLVDDEETVVEFVGGLDREFGRRSQCRWRAGSIHEKRGGAMMHLRRTSAPQARRAILGAKSGLFESQGATGESDKVR